MFVPHPVRDDLVWKNFGDVENTIDQAVKAGIKIIRTWGFRDLNVTYNPAGVSRESPPFCVFAEPKLSTTTASSVRSRGRSRLPLNDLLPELGEWGRDHQ